MTTTMGIPQVWNPGSAGVSGVRCFRSLASVVVVVVAVVVVVVVVVVAAGEAVVAVVSSCFGRSRSVLGGQYLWMWVLGRSRHVSSAIATMAKRSCENKIHSLYRVSNVVSTVKAAADNHGIPPMSRHRQQLLQQQKIYIWTRWHFSTYHNVDLHFVKMWYSWHTIDLSLKSARTAFVILGDRSRPREPRKVASERRRAIQRRRTRFLRFSIPIDMQFNLHKHLSAALVDGRCQTEQWLVCLLNGPRRSSKKSCSLPWCYRWC